MSHAKDILVDINLLLYATVADYPQHIAARTWLEEQFNANDQVGLPWLSLLGFVRIVTKRSNGAERRSSTYL